MCDFLENSELGDRSFKERMFDPPEVGRSPCSGPQAFPFARIAARPSSNARCCRAGGGLPQSPKRRVDPSGQTFRDEAESPFQHKHEGLHFCLLPRAMPCKPGGCRRTRGTGVHGTFQSALPQQLSSRPVPNSQVEFNWRMEFNGWVGQKTEEWDRHLFPTVIDSIVIGYTNPRSFNSMKLRRIY